MPQFLCFLQQNQLTVYLFLQVPVLSCRGLPGWSSPVATEGVRWLRLGLPGPTTPQKAWGLAPHREVSIHPPADKGILGFLPATPLQRCDAAVGNLDRWGICWPPPKLFSLTESAEVCSKMAASESQTRAHHFRWCGFRWRTSGHEGEQAPSFWWIPVHREGTEKPRHMAAIAAPPAMDDNRDTLDGVTSRGICPPIPLSGRLGAGDGAGAGAGSYKRAPDRRLSATWQILQARKAPK